MAQEHQRQVAKAHHGKLALTLLLFFILLSSVEGFQVTGIAPTTADKIRPFPFSENEKNDDDCAKDVSACAFECRYPQTHNINKWSSLVPPVPLQTLNLWGSNKKAKAPQGIDVTVEWGIDEDAYSVARNMLKEIKMKNKVRLASPSSILTDSEEEIQRLAWSLASFRDFCQQELYLNFPRMASKECCKDEACKKKRPTRFKARIVSTRGPHGTKCPQWHIDHVPVRWIESYVGRGCEIVLGTKGIHWNAINGLHDEIIDSASTEERNRLLVDPHVANVLRVEEGRAVLLVGNRWHEFAKTDRARYDGEKKEGQNSEESGAEEESLTLHARILTPAVHKSPSPLAFSEGRVLLTQDVILD